MLGLKLLISILFLWSFNEAAPAGTIQQENLESGLVRLRRAAQLVGAGPSLGFLRNKSSGVGGTGFLTPSAGNSLGFVGTQTQAPAKKCRWVRNRRTRRYSYVCD
eukprot:GFUD01012611.1.p1 GENE.GFUD01012611.1~~GFUD01012611.1.p1  ORF type:complete len:105 (-),score=10.11 GFUD01012611.1:456-770(-)